MSNEVVDVLRNKKAKASVGYESVGHKDSHCGSVQGWPGGDCKHFEAPNGCSIVRGQISPKGWCREWQKK